LVEIFITGSLDSLGLGYMTMHALNLRLIYRSISGYGRTGPFVTQPGYDFILQVEGRLMGITGPEEGPTYRSGVSIVDITSGTYAAVTSLISTNSQTAERYWPI
jgi:crotonobetainyl-CoA:carnitine CoA-transferase CaiB-like acyl-CoA transferase